MDIKDFQRIAKAAGMKPTDRDDMTEKIHAPRFSAGVRGRDA